MLKTLLKSEGLKKLQESLRQEQTILLEGLWDAPKALLAAMAMETTGKHILILTGGSQEELRLYHDLALFTDLPVLDYPAWETLPSEGIAPSPDIVGERYHALKNLLNARKPHLIISSLQACLQKLIKPSTFAELNITIRQGATLPFATLLVKLDAMGYQRRPTASDKGEYAVRGGIVDIFPVGSPDPYRIEFWGDDVESIRTYDPIGQKSTATAGKVEITPGQELELVDKTEELCSIVDYLGDKAIIIFDELLDLEDRYATLVSMSEKPNRAFSSLDALMLDMDKYQKIYLTQTPVEQLSEVRVLDKGGANYYSQSATSHHLSFQMFNRTIEAHRLTHPLVRVAEYFGEEHPEEEIGGDQLLELIGTKASDNTKLIFLCASPAEEHNLQAKIVDRQLSLPTDTQFQLGYLSSGFVVADIATAYVPTTEFTKRYKLRRQKQRSTYHTPPSEIFELSPGDAVVHLNNGIGRFLGLERRPNHVGIETEFMILEYAENSRLFVPMNQAHLVNKYIGSNEEKPRLHTLGSNRWKTTKQTTERAIMGYAADLLQLYAHREIKGGFAYKPDSDDLLAFEEEFPFVETEDQLRAIADIKKDMVSNKAMDRLVCGDVGYGKTEVAMRAAFKAVLDGGKQVAVLVPTTVLAMQHYESFCERMANFPVRIGVLSRFRTAKEMRETLEGVAAGSVDILIGTHRIVSKDVIFANLGLVLIDEEQRFGVRAKEHLKKIRSNVDCITLTATPIPRTLYMSLIGVRDMSVISTPPQDRLPIKTILAEDSDEMIKNALLRELARDGQAYVIHNRVESIFEFASRIKKLLPQARVVVGHGQMDGDELDDVFHAFKSGRADILVATTIVENGIDIPNANTIIIDRADRFGLADLYQLRGRVGRWNRRAYSYLVVPRMRALPEISQKRLAALQETSGYGGGMKLAMRDLEIRGAGDILGTEQSGHVSAIGFHLYCKLLKRTIQALQGGIPSVLTDTKIEFPIDARLPEEYVNEVSLRMEIYQRLGEAMTWEEVTELWNELKDRFGPPPEPAKWLYHLTRLRVYASRHGFTLLKLERLSMTAEQQKGKTVTTKQFLLKHPRTPVELETNIIQALKKEFKLAADKDA
ncbi:MAG: transcription-repair coupling factor [Chlamydiales bacterium]|nr:transcription-repair coupling factor [Chlamydiales bacterium]